MQNEMRNKKLLIRSETGNEQKWCEKCEILLEGFAQNMRNWFKVHPVFHQCSIGTKYFFVTGPPQSKPFFGYSQTVNVLIQYLTLHPKESSLNGQHTQESSAFYYFWPLGQSGTARHGVHLVIHRQRIHFRTRVVFVLHFLVVRCTFLIVGANWHSSRDP